MMHFSQIFVQQVNCQQLNKSLESLSEIEMKPIVAAIALINGMVGSTILVIPILTLTTGTFISFVVILLTGFLSFYSCYLYIQHLGNHSDLDKAMYYHFWNSKAVKVFYDFVIFFNILLVLIVYFELICQQWEGLLPYNVFNPIGNAIGLFILILLLKYARFGAHLLGYGLISIIMYCIFLIWILISQPDGDNKVPPIGKGAAFMAATMAQAFSIQQIFIPVLKQLPISQTKNFVKYTLTAYLVGGSIYLYIAYAGSFGIINRTPVKAVQTIQDYFQRDQWQVAVIQILYLIHLYSAFGQFCLITKKRFFGIMNTIFKIKNSRQNQFFSIPEIIFVFIIIGSGLAVQLGNITIEYVIQINGAIVGFFFIYLFPALLQFKCLYFARPKPVFQVVFRQSSNGNANNAQLNERSSTVRTRPLNIDITDTKDNANHNITNNTNNMNNTNNNMNNTNNYVNNTNNNFKQQLSVHIVSDSVNNRRGTSPEILYRQYELHEKKSGGTQQAKVRRTSKISAFQLQTGKKMNQQQLIPGNDKQSVLLSLGAEKQKHSMQIQKLNQVCPCVKPEGLWKVFDLTSIFGMIGLGLFVMVYQMMNITAPK